MSKQQRIRAGNKPKPREHYQPGEVVEIDLSAIPQHVSKSLSSALHKALTVFYSDPANCAKYEAWLANRAAQNN